MYKKLLRKLNVDKVRKSNEFHYELSTNLDKTVASIKKIIGESDDIVQRDFLIGKKVKATLFFIDGLADDNGIESKIIKPLIYFSEEGVEKLKGDDFIDYISKEVATFVELSVETTFDDAMLPFMSGETLLVIDGIAKFILFETRSFNQRSIEDLKVKLSFADRVMDLMKCYIRMSCYFAEELETLI